MSHRRAADPEVRGRILRCGRVGKLASSTQTCRTLLCTSVTHPGERRCRFSASARWRRTWPPRSSTASQPPPPLPLRRPPQVPASVWRQVAVATICSLATLGYGAWLPGLLAALGARLGELAAPTASDNQQPADSKKQPSQGESEVVRAKWWELYGHTALAHGAVPGASGGPPPTSLRGAVQRGVAHYLPGGAAAPSSALELHLAMLRHFTTACDEVGEMERKTLQVRKRVLGPHSTSQTKLSLPRQARGSKYVGGAENGS